MSGVSMADERESVFARSATRRGGEVSDILTPAEKTERVIQRLEAEVERLKAERDRFQAYVHAVQPVLDPAAIGRDAEHYGREVRRLQKAEAEAERLRAALKEIEDRVARALADSDHYAPVMDIIVKSRAALRGEREK